MKNNLEVLFNARHEAYLTQQVRLCGIRSKFTAYTCSGMLCLVSKSLAIAIFVLYIVLSDAHSKVATDGRRSLLPVLTSHDESANNQRHRLRHERLLLIRGGFDSGASSFAGASNADVNVEIQGCPAKCPFQLNGGFQRTEWDMNGKPHYEKLIIDKDKETGKTEERVIHLYWNSNQWIIHLDLDPSKNFNNLIAYCKSSTDNPLQAHTTSTWYVKVGKSFVHSPQFRLCRPGDLGSASALDGTQEKAEVLPELLGVPRVLLPLYLSFMLDAIAVGLAMPLLPFYVMELGANALQLSVVVSSNYVAQTIGCIVMGRVSDKMGRKVVLQACLLASCVSYMFVSRAKSLPAVALARIISGSFGGLVPIMQSCVADVTPQEDRPKYIGRIMATFGLGFVLGPALSASLPTFSTRKKIQIASALPLCGFFLSLLFFKETKGYSSASQQQSKVSQSRAPSSISQRNVPTTRIGDSGTSNVARHTQVNSPVTLLVLNGFLIMYAFATETIYAMFIKDSFGYGERALSTLFAINGIFIGIFQVFFIKPLVSAIGKHATLMLGNMLLAIGMIGVALVREQVPHFLLFTLHIVGYSIADTSLASLISKYSTFSSQGSDLAMNQAAQSCARVLSPLIAGTLYERSKKSMRLPVGALPFLAGAFFPAMGIAIPALLYHNSRRKKMSKQIDVSYNLNKQKT